MARIRTIKPAFFRHEGLFEAEVEEQLPLRVAFAGLFTVADRDGRFRWQPRVLKLDILPFDDVSFTDILDALVKHGFIVKYQVGDETFGHIPTFAKHQHVNQREADSDLPSPDDPGARTCENIPAHGEGKGTGREGNGTQPPAGAAGVDRNSYPEDFDLLWKTYKPIASPNSTKADASKAFERLSAADKAICQIGLQAYVNWLAAERRKRADTPAKHLATFINRKGWEPFMEAVANQQPMADPKTVWLPEDDPAWESAAALFFSNTGKRLTANGSREQHGIGAYVPKEFLSNDRLKMELKGVG